MLNPTANAARPFIRDEALKNDVKVFTRLVLSDFKSTVNTIQMKCRDAGGENMNFILIGMEQTKCFLKDFGIGDSINVVSDGGVILRMSKGIDTEV